MIPKKSTHGDPKLENRNFNWSVKAMVIAPRLTKTSRIDRIEFREWKFSVNLN